MDGMIADYRHLPASAGEGSLVMPSMPSVEVLALLAGNLLSLGFFVISLTGSVPLINFLLCVNLLKLMYAMGLHDIF